MNGKPNILVMDQEPHVRHLLTGLLAQEGYCPRAVEDTAKGLEVLRDGDLELVLLDLESSPACGLEVIREIQVLDPDVEIVLLTAFACIESAVAATKNGVFDYLVKPFKSDELLLVVRNGLERRRLSLENQRLRRSLKPPLHFEGMVGKSEVMQRVFGLIHHLAPRATHALITGASGTGKELVARAIHRLGPRHGGPFVALKAGEVSPGWMGNGLLGGDRQAFDPDSVGPEEAVQAARGGTLFLDDVSSLSLESQAALLEVIQPSRSGSAQDFEDQSIEVRILAATRKNLRDVAGRGRFREDLYERLSEVTIGLPPLCERREDIPLLVKECLAHLASAEGRPILIHSTALKALVDHHWPGNVRELEHVLELAVILARPGRLLLPDHLPSEVLASRPPHLSTDEILRNRCTLKESVADFERSLILAALESNDWNQRRTARVLRTIPTTLNQKMKRLRIRGA